MKKSNGFRHPMNQTETIVGWVYVFVHMFAMAFILGAMNRFLFPAMGFSLSDKWLNFIYYMVGFIFLLVFLFHYWRESFADLCANFTETLGAITIGFLACNLLSLLVNLLLGRVLGSLTNPNQAAVNAMTRLNPGVMLAIGVFLAPVVEETLFRGVVFGSLQGRNRLAAYLLSTLLFALYHLWSRLDFTKPWQLLYLLQYVPAGLTLCWSYERGRNVWCPVFLHMLLNYVSISVRIG